MPVYPRGSVGIPIIGGNVAAIDGITDMPGCIAALLYGTSALPTE